MDGGSRSPERPDRRADERTATGDEAFKVEDRRHWTLDEEQLQAAAAADAAARPPTLIDEYRLRAEAAEAKLREYIEAFKQRQREQDEFRARLEGDVERKVQLRFGELVGHLLEPLDTLDLSLAHLERTAAVEPLARGVEMARDGFRSILARHGLEAIVPDGNVFDPQEAEALRVDSVDTPELDGKVVATLQPGFRLGERVVRPARVVVGRFQG